MRKRLLAPAMIVFTGACALLFSVFYREAKEAAIASLDAEQRIHAEQAARGIEDFFTTWRNTLAAFARMHEIVEADAAGARDLELFYEAHEDQIRSITRMDERGVIVVSRPFADAAGRDITSQEHVREILRTREPVVSEPFRAVQGFEAVALHVPVFEGGAFRGSLAVVIDFESLARRYLDAIRIGRTGYAWVVDREGTILYTPVPGMTGRSAAERFRGFPEGAAMLGDMLKGREGAATYLVDLPGERAAGPVRKYAVYEPVKLGNTFWSIAVASTERELLSGLISYRNRLALIVGLVYLGGIAFALVGAKAWLIVREEDRRRQAETTLRESERRFRTLFESNPDGVFLTDPETLEIVDCNPVACAMNGYARDELIGRSINLLHPDDVARTLEADVEGRRAFVRELKEKGVVTAESVHRRKDGTAFDLETSMCLTTLGGRELVMGIDRDITERKRMEATVRASEAQLSLILNNVSDVVFAVAAGPDGEFRFTSVNRRFLEATGLPESAVAGRPVRDVIPAPAHELVLGKYREAIESGQPAHWEEASEYPSGTKVGHVTVVPVPGERGGCAQLVGMVHDITDVRRANDAIRELNAGLERRVAERTAELAVARDRAEAADRLKSAFLATMSHELRTPLNSIIGFTGIILQGLAGPLTVEQAKQLEMVRDSSRHLLALINDVLDLSKIEAGQLLVDREPFDVRASIAKAVGIVAPLAERKGLALRAEVAPEVGTAVGDARRVEQVLLNLLNNAVKFTERGAVTLTAAAAGGALRIAVSDTGIGIRAEDLDQLFRPFRQIDTGLTRRHEGTGLGLAICRRLAALLGGEVDAASVWGEGSVFTFTLPVEAPAGR